MKIKKLLTRGLIVLIVLIVVAVLVVGLCLDSIVKKGVETFGPQITKVSVTVDSINVGLLTASGKVKGLVVGNPEGYKSTNAISLGLASASINPASLLSDKIVIRSIRVESPDVTLEGGLLNNNLTKILDNVKGAPGKGEEGKSSETLKAEGKPSKKLEVDDFVITGAKVHILAADLTVPIPDIHFSDLGKGPDGITAADLTEMVMKELVANTLKAAAGSAGDLGKGAADAAKGAGEKATGAIGNVGKGISDLFKK